MQKNSLSLYEFNFCVYSKVKLSKNFDFSKKLQIESPKRYSKKELKKEERKQRERRRNVDNFDAHFKFD